MANTQSLTPQQQAVSDAAQALLQALHVNIPTNVAHYAVEEVRSAVVQMQRVIDTVSTFDTRPARES